MNESLKNLDLLRSTALYDNLRSSIQKEVFVNHFVDVTMIDGKVQPILPKPTMPYSYFLVCGASSTQKTDIELLTKKKDVNMLKLGISALTPDYSLSKV